MIFLTQLSLFFFCLKFAFRAAQDTNTKLEKVNRLLENKNVQLEYAASHDSLTTIPNRAALIDYLHRKLEKMKRELFFIWYFKKSLPRCDQLPLKIERNLLYVLLILINLNQ